MPSALVAPAAAPSDEIPSATPPARVVSDPAALRRVLIVKLSSLGDVVHALPLADSLRAGLGPQASIVWAVRGKFASLLRGNPSLTAVCELRDRGTADLLSFFQTVREAAGGAPYDAALDAQGLFISGLITRASGARIRIGMDRNREGNAAFMTHPIIPGRHRAHIVSKLLSYGDVLGIPRVAPRPQRYLAAGEAAAAAMLFDETDQGGPIAPRIGLIIGASTPDKTWPVEHWAMLVGMLSRAGFRAVLLGGAGEQALADQIGREAKIALVTNLTGRTSLPVLASVIAGCSAIVGGDSGPTHLAVAVGAPVVGLYGVTDPALTGPEWGGAPAITLDYAERAAPPAERRPRHPTLPDALARIPVRAVFDAVESLVR